MVKVNKRTTISTLKLFLPLSLIAVLVAITIIRAKNKSELEILKNLEQSSTQVIVEKIEFNLSSLLADLKMLTSLNELSAYLNTPDQQEHKKALEDFFVNLASHHKVYDQIRIIDETGMEAIRVNYNKGSPQVVPQSQLQNKKGRYYFEEAIVLNQGEIFISPLDLNIENGAIEQPLKPMLRIATPIFDKKGKKRGICMLNYFGKNITNQIKNIQDVGITQHIMLLNAEGYWLKCDHPENTWGFMYDDKKHIKFPNIYPKKWKIIQSQDASQFMDKSGLYTFKTIHPLSLWTQDKIQGINVNNEKWKVISYITHNSMFDKMRERNRMAGIIVLVIIGLCFVMSLAIAQSKEKSRIAQQELIENEKRLKESNETKDRFFSIIAHDLRSPFNSLLGISELIVKKYEIFDTDKLKLYMTSIHKELSKTYNLLENLLSWSRSQRNTIVVNRETLNLHLLAEESIEVLHPSANKKQIKLKNNISPDCTIDTDRELIKTVIRNLISNAIKFTPEQGNITISATTEAQSTTKIEVSDTGIGMSQTKLSQLFKIGENVSTPGTNNENGTGLGLIVCKEFIEKLDGSITVKSELGKGTTFCCILP